MTGDWQIPDDWQPMKTAPRDGTWIQAEIPEHGRDLLPDSRIRIVLLGESMTMRMLNTFWLGMFGWLAFFVIKDLITDPPRKRKP